MTAYRQAAAADLAGAVAAGASRRDASAERRVLSELPLHLFRQVPVFTVTTPAGDVGIMAAAFGKRPASEWGRYVNVYVIHIRMTWRACGYAKAAYQAAAAEGTARGCSRLTTTAATTGGWRVHRSLDWPAWGLNTARQIVTDTDLTGAPPPGLPARCARLETPGRPMTLAEHAAALTNPAGPYRLPWAGLPAAYRTAR